MQEHFLNIAVTKEFLKWSEDEVKEYLSDDKLSVNKEKDVFDALMKWINYDEDSRTSSLSQLLSIVRLHHIDTNFLLEYVVNNFDNLCSITEIVKGIKENLYNVHQALPQRTGLKANRLVIVYQSKIVVYNPITSVIEFECSFDSNAYTPALVDEKVILVGKTKVRSFDLKTETWQELTPTQTKRFAHTVGVLNGHVYAIGGEKENTVERWDAKLNKWSYIPSMQQKREDACTAVIDEKLFVIGGKSTDDGILSTVECFNPHTNAWSFCSSMVEKKEYANAAVLNGEIYVFGGRTPTVLCCIEKYNPDTNIWTKVTEMKEKRWALGACLFGNKIILFGGHNGEKWSTSMEEYDPITNKCKLIPTAFPECEYKVDIFPYLSTK